MIVLGDFNIGMYILFKSLLKVLGICFLIFWWIVSDILRRLISAMLLVLRVRKILFGKNKNNRG